MGARAAGRGAGNARRKSDLAGEELMQERQGAKSAVTTIGLHGLVALLAMLSLAPVVWVVCSSIKRPEDFYAYVFLPHDLSRLTLMNYVGLLRESPFGQWIINSLVLSSAQTALVVTLSSLGGFALAKYEFFGKRPLMAIMVGVLALPIQVLLPSGYELMYDLGWVNSYLAIVVPGAVSVFGMFLFKASMEAVPDELLLAGRVDGCSELRLWWEVALPVVRPTVGAFTLLSFLASWNSFLWPQVVLQQEGKYTLPIGMANLQGLPEIQQNYGMLMAGTLLGVLPVAILFFVLQKDFVAGLAEGAVKG
jgi:multiple sugar transport system permease protein